MTFKCPYCSYTKPDRPLSRPILELMNKPDLPDEDYALWLERLIMTHGFTDYHGVKIHMGHIHKDMTYKYDSPEFIFNPIEEEAFHHIRLT